MTDRPRFYIEFPPDAVRIRLSSGTEAVICRPEPVPEHERPDPSELVFPDGWEQIGYVDATAENTPLPPASEEGR